MQFNDKIIDDQGNVKTFSGGKDARLYYLDVNGEEKKYLLEGEAESPDVDLTQYYTKSEIDEMFTSSLGELAEKLSEI